MGAADDGDDLGGVVRAGPADLGHAPRELPTPPARAGERTAGLRGGVGGDERPERAGRDRRLVLPARQLPAERPVDRHRRRIQRRQRVAAVGHRVKQRGHQPAADATAPVLGRDLDRGDARARDGAAQPPLAQVVDHRRPGRHAADERPEKQPLPGPQPGDVGPPGPLPGRVDPERPLPQVELRFHVVVDRNRPNHHVIHDPPPYGEGLPTQCARADCQTRYPSFSMISSDTL